MERRRWQTMVLAGALLALGSLPSGAAVHFVNLGMGAPPSSVGPIPVRAFDVAPQAAITDGTNVSSIPGCPVGGSIATSIPMMKLTVPSSFNNWSGGYAGTIFFSNYVASATLTLPPGATAFYFFAESNLYGTYNISATTNSGATSGPIAVTAPSGALGFGFYTDDKDTISTIAINVSEPDYGFAIGEFGISGGPGWAVVTNFSNASIDTIDLSTNTAYGPFLGGSLGGGGSLWEVAVTPDGHYALVANFSGQTVYRVDLSNPASPVLAGSVSVPLYAEDMAISPDGTFAMVTDGSQSNQICVINLSTFTLQTTYTVPGSTYITSIAIAPDNQTWVAADREDNVIYYGTYSLGPGFAYTGSKSTPSPNDVAISPDGQTALVTNEYSASVSAFSITGPGTLVAGNTVGGLPSTPQSTAFSPGGATAYVHSLASPARISWLTVTAPGTIALGAAGAATLTGFGGSTYYGVDGLAVTPDGQRLVVGNTGGTSAVDLVDTSAFGVTNLATPGSYPVGVATFMAFSGSVITNPYNLHFKDDYGRSEMCVNSTVTPAQWKYSVLKGNGTGKTYTGTGTVVNGSGYMRLTASAGSGYGLTLIYYTTAHRATATFTYRPDAVSSALYDSNTLDDGPCP